MAPPAAAVVLEAESAQEEPGRAPWVWRGTYPFQAADS